MITVTPGLAGDLLANSFTVIKKPNANTVMANSFNYWSFANCGPVVTCLVTEGGGGYISLPSLDVRSNTIIKSLGILGSLEIVDGGIGYEIGDTIEFITPTFGFGGGAAAEVTEVDEDGVITEVRFVPVTGEFTGGSGYELGLFPTCNIISNNVNEIGRAHV